MPLEHLRDIRDTPLCTICGHPAFGHPKDLPDYHNFTPPPEPVVTVTAEPVPVEPPDDHEPAS
jgi:hypothetical protein